MVSRVVFSLVLVLVILVNLRSVFVQDLSLQFFTQVLFLIPLVGLYYPKLPKANLNLYGFISCAAFGAIFSVFGSMWYFQELSQGFWILSFIFLVREAIQFTKYTRGNNYMLLYFLIMVSSFGYLLSLHISEIEEELSDKFIFLMYLIYYLNLLVFGVTALVFYLNSFSKKSVFFISLALSFIVSEVLKDMGIFYFKDISVEIAANLLKFGALTMVFMFFTTKEKKLRLLNMI